MNKFRGNVERLRDDQLKMTEFRVTFGWGQPHGPSPMNNRGHYSTIWAYDSVTASSMAFERYGGKWAMIYFPAQWKVWGDSMKETKELEVLQFYELSIIVPYPDKLSEYDGIVLGSPIR